VTGAGGGVTVQSCDDSTYTDSETGEVNDYEDDYIDTADGEPNQGGLWLTANLVLVGCGSDFADY
jgi:hypothetical protein